MTEKLKLGVYFHEKKEIAIYYSTGKYKFEIDKNKHIRHPILRTKVHMIEQISGRGGDDYFQKKSLKNYEFIGEF